MPLANGSLFAVGNILILHWLLQVEVSIEALGYRQKGPLLITHDGFSGPAVLRLSAWAARELYDSEYNFHFKVPTEHNIAVFP